jgi:hypothetical protein
VQRVALDDHITGMERLVFVYDEHDLAGEEDVVVERRRAVPEWLRAPSRRHPLPGHL